MHRHTREKMLQTAILDQRVKKEWEQDYTHVDHSQLDIPYHLESCTPYCGFRFAQALMILKPVHIVCMVLICIGDLTGCGLHGTVFFFFFFF